MRARWWRWGGAVALVLGGLGWGLDRAFPPDLSRYRDLSITVVDRRGELLRPFTAAGQWRFAATPAQVDPRYLEMLIAYEDRRFWWHPGVDPIALARAFGQLLYHGRLISGGSTLTMQVARLLEPRPRTFGAKLIEMVRALQLEWRYSKSEILAIYLTLAPYGGNLEGIRAASLAYFGKEPRYLLPSEAALLVVLPQSPTRRRPDHHPELARQARDKVLARMVRDGVLTPQQGREAQENAVPTQRRDMPFSAPHLARRLRHESPQAAVIATTIDGDLQRQVEALVAQIELDPRASAAVVVMDNASGEVLVYVASRDFFAEARQGQVDMIQAVRSPGSTLKPLVYAMGFEELILHPETLIEDAPVRFGDYTPENFQRDYSGEVTAREALQRSLNVPAVRVLERVGPMRVGARLQQVGLPLRLPQQSQDRPGLPLVLGGVGATLADLVTLYGGFADVGQVKPLRYRADGALATSQRLVSAAAAWYIGDILRGSPPPSAWVASRYSHRLQSIAHKTGTSYGFRDAWAVGFDGGYTVGVWVGRPDGTPSPDHYGRKTAAPLLFRVFDLLPKGAPQVLAPPPAEVLALQRAALPAALQRWRAPPAIAGQSDLAIVFPPAGARVELPRTSEGALAPLPLQASGGQGELRWFVNGLPVRRAGEVGRQRRAQWQPDGAGAVQITVVDAAGASASATAWLLTQPTLAAPSPARWRSLRQ